MIVIRSGVFETNSSSVHAVCISRNKYKGILPESIDFYPGEFGWEFRKYSLLDSKATYLYSCILDRNKDDADVLLRMLEDRLHDIGIECVFHGLDNTNSYEYNGKTYEYYTSASVDHNEGSDYFVNAVLLDSEKLCNYLFGYDSFIVTGNDNSYTDEHKDVEEHEKSNCFDVYWKVN